MDTLLRALKEDVNQLFRSVNEASIERNSLIERVGQLRKDVDAIEEAMEDQYVRKERYQIAEGLIFGEAVLLLVGVISAILHFVLAKPGG